MTRFDSWRKAAWLSMLVAMMTACSGGTEPEERDDRTAATTALRGPGESDSRLFEVDSKPFGVSMEDWAFDWLRWEYSIPAATNPALVAGASYDQHQPEHVFFVPDGPNHNDAFSVSRHKAVAIMLSQINNDFPCPDPTFKPAPGQSLFDFLSAGLTTINDNITVLDVTLDGVPIPDLQRYRFTTKRLIFFIGDKSLAANFDACVTGLPQPAVTDDLFFLLKPLDRGRHLLTVHIVNKDGNVFDRTRTITSE